MVLNNMYKHTAFMTVSTAVRLLSGMVLFIVLARILGPQDFGRLMYQFTVTSIAMLVLDYGFGQQLLREIGRAPERIAHLMGEIFIAKLWLTLIILAASVFYLFIGVRTVVDIMLFWSLLFANMFVSFGDYFMVGFRGIGQFHKETRVATISSVLHFALITSIAMLGGGLLMVALGFVVSRAIYLGLSWLAYRTEIGKLVLNEAGVSKIVHTLKSGFPYAADTGFTNFFYQVDTLIVNYYLGLVGVGVYQAGMRFLQGAMQFAPVLGNVYLPALASNATQPQKLKALAAKLNVQMLTIGMAGWAFFTFAGKWLTHFAYGAKFAILTPLWPYIGLLMLVRFVTGSQGILLTASGSQKVRVYAQIAALAVLWLSSPWLIHHFGLAGMFMSLTLTISTLLLIFIITLLIKHQPSGFSFVTTFLALISATIGIVILHG